MPVIHLDNQADRIRYPLLYQLIIGKNGNAKTNEEIEKILEKHFCGVGADECPLKKPG